MEAIATLLQAQNNRCAICKRYISFNAIDKVDKPHIDHCHKTGEVRGILCLTCNTGIGMFKDSEKLIDAAKVYLQLQRERLNESASKEDAIVRSNGNIEPLEVSRNA